MRPGEALPADAEKPCGPHAPLCVGVETLKGVGEHKVWGKLQGVGEEGRAARGGEGGSHVLSCHPGPS